MNESIFRKKSIEKISSPEQFNEYIRVSNPGVWMTLFCIIILLTGMGIWGIFGRLETVLDVCAVCENGKLICYVKEENISDVKEGMNVRINDVEYMVKSIPSLPIQVTDDFGMYVVHVGNLQTGEWVYEVVINAGLEDGVYEAKIITESKAPLSFLVN